MKHEALVRGFEEPPDCRCSVDIAAAALEAFDMDLKKVVLPRIIQS